ncbi:MAG: hypothetical protein K2K27_07720 [Muribaculaceae bacterium]|nr:hypothetical protein [Muribaculaceae bacterium]
MKYLFIKLLTTIVICISFSSCATMTRWTDSKEKNAKMYTVTIRSKTPGLNVYSTEKGDDRLLGKTPCQVYSDKAKIKYVTVQNGDIYETVNLKTTLRPSTYWNFVPYYTWIWGFFVDRGTRRSVIYSQKDYYIDM